jgi:ELWxxDGT repeat protein
MAMNTKPINLVMFAGKDAAGNNGLWVTDGTAAGTHEITGISGANPGGLFGGRTGFPPDFTVFNDKVLFSGLDAAGNIGLWVTDGTAGGTYELTNISNANAGGLFDGYFPAFTVLNGKVLFNGIDAAGNEGLWVTDGTAAGTQELTGISGAYPGGLFHGWNPVFTVFNGEVLFTGLDAANNFGLWVTDGTAAGTHELTNISGANPGPAGGLFGGEPVVAPADFTVFNGEVLFNGIDAAGLSGLWMTNGTAAGTYELTGIAGAYTGGPTGAAPGGLNPQDLTVFKNEVLFAGTDTAGAKGLWVTDGTAAGTHELTGISGAYAAGIFTTGFPPDFTVYKNNEVLFEGTDTNGQVGLWVSNGTAAGTHELTGIKGANTSGSGLNPENLTVFNNEVLFRGVDASGQIGLWVTNGTAAGTHELTGISGAYTGPGGMNANSLTAVTLQLIQAMASSSPTGSTLTASPLNQTNDVMQPSNDLAQPH